MRLGFLAVAALLSTSVASDDCPSSSFDLQRYEKDADYYEQVCHDGAHVKKVYFSPPARPGASKIFDVAGSSFGIPKSLLTCIVFVETNYDGSKVSHKGAEGLGQTTLAGLDQINKILRRKPFQEFSKEKFNEKWDKRRKGLVDERARSARSA